MDYLQYPYGAQNLLNNIDEIVSHPSSHHGHHRRNKLVKPTVNGYEYDKLAELKQLTDGI